MVLRFDEMDLDHDKQSAKVQTYSFVIGLPTGAIGGGLASWYSGATIGEGMQQYILLSLTVSLGISFLWRLLFLEGGRASVEKTVLG